MDGPIGKVEQSLDRLKRSTYRNAVPQIFGQKYWYVFGFTKDGKTVIWGPFMAAKEADSSLAELDDGEVFEKETRDLARATREIKAELMKRGEDPDKALRRVLHKHD